MYIEKRLIVPLSLVLLVVGLVTLLAVVGMTFWLGNRTNEHFDGVIRSRDVRVAAVEIRSAVQSAEASQRGLLLTGNQIYLSPYDAAKATANRQLDNIRRNLDGDHQFQAVLQRLTAIALPTCDAVKFTLPAPRTTTAPVKPVGLVVGVTVAPLTSMASPLIASSGDPKGDANDEKVKSADVERLPCPSRDITC